MIPAFYNICMTIKEKIFLDLKDIVHPKILYQILDFITLLKRNTNKLKGNCQNALSLAGSLSNQDSEEIQKTIDTEFNTIEGEWYF